MTGPRRIDLIGVPFNSSGGTDGVAWAPKALRKAGLVDELLRIGSVVDRGDIPIPPTTSIRDPDTHLIAGAALPPVIRSVREAVAASIGPGRFPLVLGGDCPVLLGCLGPIDNPWASGLLFVDGHEDAWPADRSTTGEAADMELGWLLGVGVEDLPHDIRSEIPSLAPEAVIVLGARDEVELAEAGVESIGDLVRIVRPAQIAATTRTVAEAAVAHLDAHEPWWLHVDLDVLSTESLAAVDYPQAGGLDWQALTEITRRALASRAVLGWTVTIYNPDLDPSRQDADRIVRYIAEALTTD